MVSKRVTQEYETRRRLNVPGVGIFSAGARCALTDEEYAANRNSLVPVKASAPPAAQEDDVKTPKTETDPAKTPEPDKAPKGDPKADAGTKAGGPEANKDRMDTDHTTR